MTGSGQEHATIAGRLRRLARFDALVLASLIWFLGKYVRYAFPPLFEPLGATYQVSNTVLGVVFTGFMLVYAAMQFPSGLLADRFGSVRVVAAGALLTAAGALFLVVDAPFAALAVAMLVMGAGTGAHKTVAVSLLSRTYPARTGRALGVFDTFGTLGGVAAPAAVVAFVALPGVFGASWRTLFLVAGVVGVALALAFLARIPRRLPGESDPRPDAGSSDGGDLRRYAALLGTWRVGGFVVVTILFSFAYNGAVAFLPLYLTREAGIAASTASLLYSALFVASFVQIATGEASDRVGTLPVIVVTLGLATAGIVGLLALGGSATALALGAAIVGLGLGAHGFRPVRGTYLMTVVPPAVAGGSLGVVRTLLMAAGAVSPAVTGYLSEVAGFRTAFALLAGSLVAATALAAALWVLDR